MRSMKAMIGATLAALGLSAPLPEVTAPEPAPVVDLGADPAARAYGPRGTHPRRRSYGLPCAGFETPNRRLQDRAESRESRILKEARRAVAWARTCTARGYA